MLILIKKTPKREGEGGGGGGELEFNKFFFKHNKFKHKNHKYKEMRLEKANSSFIVVQHFLVYVNSS